MHTYWMRRVVPTHTWVTLANQAITTSRSRSTSSKEYHPVSRRTRNKLSHPAVFTITLRRQPPTLPSVKGSWRVPHRQISPTACLVHASPYSQELVEWRKKLPSTLQQERLLSIQRIHWFFNHSDQQHQATCSPSAAPSSENTRLRW